MKSLTLRAAVAVLFLPLSLSAATPREELKTLTAELQKAPSDNALRGEIVSLAATLNPAPAVPKEARRPFVMASTFQKEAKAPADYEKAIKAYGEALLLAPWWGDAYFNLSVTLESAGRYDEAGEALKLYLLGKPKDAEQAEDRLYALEAKKALAAAPAKPAGPDFSGKWGNEQGDRIFFKMIGKEWMHTDNERNPDWKPVTKAEGNRIWTEFDNYGMATTHREFVLSEDGTRLDITRWTTQTSAQRAREPGVTTPDMNRYSFTRK